MTIEIKRVDEVSEEERTQREEILREFTADAFPDVDSSTGGVFHARTLLPQALLSAIADDNFDRLRQSQSLRLVDEDPTLAEDDVVDNILSNHLITRTAGNKATGQAVVVISASVTTIIAANTVFTSNELTFETTRAFTGVTSEGLILSTADRLIQPRADGTFSFLVDVEATVEGEGSRLKQDTALGMPTPPAGFVSSFAAADFTGGRSEQTNTDLVAELATGISTKVLAGRNNISSLLVDNFPNITHTSLVGFGDAEMTRDRNNIFSLSHGGKTDIYLAPADRPASEVTIKTATLVDAATQTMQVSFTKAEFPGFYTITKIVREGDESINSLETVSLVRDVDLTGDGFIPEIPDVIHGVFTAFQTATLRFIDPAFDDTGGATTADYEFSVLGFDDIDDIQNLVSNRDRRNPAADYLVKAAVPIITGVALTVDKLASELTDSVELETTRTNIQQEVSRRVNASGFSLGQLPASLVIAAASDILVGSATVRTPVELTGALIRPDGTTQNFFETDVIEIPDDPENFISQRTVLFFLDPTDVLVTFANVGTIEV